MSQGADEESGVEEAVHEKDAKTRSDWGGAETRMEDLLDMLLLKLRKPRSFSTAKPTLAVPRTPEREMGRGRKPLKVMWPRLPRQTSDRLL